MMQTETAEAPAREDSAAAEIKQQFDRAERYGVLIWLIASAALTAVLALRETHPLNALFAIWLLVSLGTLPLLCIGLEIAQRVLLRPVWRDDSMHETAAYSAEEGRQALRWYYTVRTALYAATVLLVGTGVLLISTAFFVLMIAIVAAAILDVWVPRHVPAPDTPAADVLLQIRKQSPHRTLLTVTLIVGAFFVGGILMGYEYTAYARRSSMQATAKQLLNAIGMAQTDCEERGTDPALWKLSTEYGGFGAELVSPELTETVTYYFSDYAKQNTFYYKIIADSDGKVAAVWLSRRPITASTQPQTVDGQMERLKSFFRYKDAVVSFPDAFS